MASPRIEYAVLPAGEGPGQDRCFTADGLVVVLDGASAIDPLANPDATEYVDALGPLVIEQATGRPGVDLPDALAEAIRLTAEKLALTPGTAPSSTVSILRWGDENVDVLVLGDSPIIMQFNDGYEETIVQRPQAHIAADLRLLYRKRLAAGHGFGDAHSAILAEIQRAEAGRRNLEGGYWIAEATPIASHHASVRRFDRELTTNAAVLTDGAHIVGQHLGVDWFRDVGSEGLAARLRELSSWEREHDPEALVLPRSKRHDDKAIAVVRFSGRQSLAQDAPCYL